MERARAGRSRGEATHTPLSYLPHPARAFGAPPPPHRKGAVVAISPARAQAQERPALVSPSPITIPYTVPWGYHPGWGSGREPPPRQREPYWPSTGLPRRSGGSRGKSPGRAQPGVSARFCPPPASCYALFSSLPHPTRAFGAPPPPHRKGAVVVISPARAQAQERPALVSPSPITIPYTVPWEISPGEGLGEGTPSPAKRTVLALRRAPAQERGFTWQEPGQGAAGGVGPIPPSAGISPCTVLISPPPHPRLWRSSPAPQEGGSSREITGKSLPGMSAPILSLTGTSPHTALLSPTPPAPSALLPRPRGRGQ